MIETLGDREAFLFREATKVHEEYVRGTLGALRARLAERDAVKGEIVLVVAGAPQEAAEHGVAGGALRPADRGGTDAPGRGEGDGAPAGPARARGVPADPAARRRRAVD